MSTEIAVKTVANPAVVSITAHVPEDAMSAGLLGTERVGHGVRIRDDGLIATIGYVVHEAENLWIGSAETVVPGFVIGYDFDSGLALVKPSLPLRGPAMRLGRADSLAVGDAVTVASSGGKEHSIEARVLREGRFVDGNFTGRHASQPNHLVGDGLHDGVAKREGRAFGRVVDRLRGSASSARGKQRNERCTE